MKDKVKKTLALVVEPIAFGILALLFIIPTITVVNLEPITKAIKELDILGVSNNSELDIEIIGGSHQIFSREKIQQEQDGTYIYTTILERRGADRYSKPILEIVNNKQEEIKLEIYGSTHLPTYSDISIILNDQVYKLQTSRGDTLTQKVLLFPNQKYIVYLALESFSNIQFNETFELRIKELE